MSPELWMGGSITGKASAPSIALESPAASCSGQADAAGDSSGGKLQRAELGDEQALHGAVLCLLAERHEMGERLVVRELIPGQAFVLCGDVTGLDT